MSTSRFLTPGILSSRFSNLYISLSNTYNSIWLYIIVYICMIVCHFHVAGTCPLFYIPESGIRRRNSSTAGGVCSWWPHHLVHTCTFWNFIVGTSNCINVLYIVMSHRMLLYRLSSEGLSSLLSSHVYWLCILAGIIICTFTSDNK